MTTLSLSRVTRLLACLAAAAFPVLAWGEVVVINSENHPALKRALSETPQADKDANGQLSLEEYVELLPQQRPNDPENPKKNTNLYLDSLQCLFLTLMLLQLFL